jgi:hypothetical protein
LAPLREDQHSTSGQPVVQGTGQGQAVHADHVEVDNRDIGPAGEHHGYNLFTVIQFGQDLNVVFFPQ